MGHSYFIQVGETECKTDVDVFFVFYYGSVFSAAVPCRFLYVIKYLFKFHLHTVPSYNNLIYYTSYTRQCQGQSLFFVKKRGGKLFSPRKYLFIAVVEIGKLRREEFFDGEAHLIEEVAGIVFGRTAAFFFGNAEVVRGDDYLDVAHYSYY